ncbi:hypothetical protein D9615_006060 [Tricholomella constricta]|uniref:NADH:flavin oxidoreductase/NADH oxidase N-terminal domain-containing protein n=1 Tax=Tricholomella constricta TaxID=117010 RepID=A0A8H5H9D9_9AGAR|nr:hypothetical protein D9615_006060 [Tricholomella constricta]
MEETAGISGVFSPIKLPCGRSLRNRLVKVAMYQHLADFLGGPPNQLHFSLYSKWAQFDWGMIVTGNVQVSKTHLTLGRDVCLPRDLSKERLLPFEQWVTSIRGSGESGALAIMQLSHAGRQSTNFVGGRFPFKSPLAPSPIRVKAKNCGWLSDAFHTLVFQTPRQMSLSDIDDVVEAFVKGARVASESGFDGIQLHAAHGYLLAQFVSPTSNERTDEYSAHPENALRLLRRIVSAIRATVAKTFVIGIKINAADYVDHNELDIADRVLNHFQAIARWGEIDFIEVSGGDYEKPDFMPTKIKSPRQALFAHFSKAAMDALASLELESPSASLPLVLLTGGLRTAELLHTALVSKHAHLLGIGRASILCPDLPRLLKERELAGTQLSLDASWSTPFRPDPNLDLSRIWNFLPTIPIVGAGINMAWYVVTIRQLAALPSSIRETLLEPDYTLGPLEAVFRMWVWVDRLFVPRTIFVLSGMSLWLFSVIR